jgi:hypothetical protein
MVLGCRFRSRAQRDSARIQAIDWGQGELELEYRFELAKSSEDHPEG